MPQATMRYGWQMDEPDAIDRRALLGDCLRRAIGWSLLAHLLAQAINASLPIVTAIPRAPGPVEGDGGIWPWLYLYRAIQYSIPIGALTGLLAGSATGLVFAALTTWRFRSLTTASALRRMARSIAVALALIAASGVRLALIRYAHYPWFGVAEFASALVLPGLAGWWVGGRLVGWLVVDGMDLGLRH
ncbi:MAG: hypothetical protein IT340_02715 [Chloroflexi bacterium]|nr:hypothetical protein [Chloroflexota bacterium]